MCLSIAILLAASSDRFGMAELESKFIGSLSDRCIMFRLTTYPEKKLVQEFLSDTEARKSDVDFHIAKSGTFRLVVSAQGMLDQSMLVYLSPGKVTKIAEQTAILGDVTGDNAITVDDLKIVKRYLGVKAKSDRWVFGDIENSYSGRECDFNGDGVVNTADLAIVQANLGKKGAAR
jgi:hypothetical protein